MNLDYWIRRLSGRSTCRLGQDARLLMTARIVNTRDRSGYIRIDRGSVVAGELLVFLSGGQITLGEWCYVGQNSRIWSATSIEIDDRVLISHGVNIFDSLTHPLRARERHAQFRAVAKSGLPIDVGLGARPVMIEDDAWIGAGAIILRGTRIGKTAVIGAGAVVKGDIPASCIVAGNPARVIRELTEDER